MNITTKSRATVMVTVAYIVWLVLTLLIGFWRLAPWTWVHRLAQMPGALLALLALEPADRLTSIQGGVAYLENARASGDVWMPEVIWRRVLALVAG